MVWLTELSRREASGGANGVAVTQNIKRARSKHEHGQLFQVLVKYVLGGNMNGVTKCVIIDRARTKGVGGSVRTFRCCNMRSRQQWSINSM